MQAAKICPQYHCVYYSSFDVRVNLYTEGLQHRYPVTTEIRVAVNSTILQSDTPPCSNLLVDHRQFSDAPVVVLHYKYDVQKSCFQA